MQSQMRRAPQQIRGEARVQKILDAAAALFDEVGYDAATSNTIAQRAGTSIGSFYHFFPDKAAVFQALLRRHQAEIDKIFDQMLGPQYDHQRLPQILEQLFDQLRDYFEKNAGAMAVFECARVSLELKRFEHELKEHLVERLTALLAVQCSFLPAEKRRLVAIVSLEVVCTLQHLSLKGESGFEYDLNDEIKKLLSAYANLYQI